MATHPFSSALLLAGALAIPAEAQRVRKLNGPLPRLGAGSVESFRLSPDETRLVYRADQELDDVFELFAASLAGGAPLRLNGALVVGGDVTDFAFAGANRVVFLGDALVDGRFELFSAPLDGSAPAVTLASQPAFGDVLRVEARAGVARVAFVADALVDDRFELFGVPADGSAAPVPLHPSFPGASDVAEVRLAPDGSFVVYTLTGSPEQTLYRAPLDGSSLPVLLASSGVPSGSSFGPLALSADGSRVVFDAADALGVPGLFSVPSDGSAAPVRLSGASEPGFALAQDRVLFVEGGVLTSATLDGSQSIALSPGATVAETPLVPTPDETRVLFVASGTLYVAPVAGGQAASALALVDADSLEDLSCDPASSRALFVRHYVLSNFPQIETVEILTSVELSGATPEVNLAQTTEFAGLGFAQGDRIVYRAFDGTPELFSVPATGGPSVRLHGPLSAPRSVLEFALNGDGSRVFFRGSLLEPDGVELYGTDPEGAGPMLRYNAPLPAGPTVGDVAAFQASEDGQRVVYRADQEVSEREDLYTVATAGGMPLPLWDSLPVPGTLLDQALSPSGQCAVFVLNESDCLLSGACPGPFHLLAVSTEGHAEPLLLATFSGRFLGPFVFDADEEGLTCLARSDEPGNGPWQVIHVPLDGSSAPVVLNPVGPEPFQVSDFDVTPDGTGVVMRSKPEQRLYFAPLDGSAPPVRLCDRSVSEYRLPSDGRRVVYRGEITLNHGELFGARLDGVGGERQLSDALDGSVVDFVLTPDGERAVYLADQGGGRRELFTVSTRLRPGRLRDLDGAPFEPVRRLTPFSAPTTVLSGYRVTSDGASALYLADKRVHNRLELHRVALDGSVAPVVLSAAPVVGGDVVDFALSPDGSRAVYRADQVADERYEIFSVPISGGAVQALAPLPSFADVQSFLIAPDSDQVVFRANRQAPGDLELFSVPLEGGSVRRLNLPAVPGGDVALDYVVLPGGGVLYRADAFQDEAWELFLGRRDGRLFRPKR